MSRGLKKGNAGILKEDLKGALEELNTTVQSDVLENMDLNQDGYFDFEEFKTAAREPTAMEQWTAALPLNNLVAAALSPLIGLHPEWMGSDPLRALSLCSDDHVRSACDVIVEGILKVLSRRVHELKNSYKTMDDKPVRVKEDLEQSKFGIGTMNCGDIPSFFEGLGGRVGE